jgi:hypothetical protein
MDVLALLVLAVIVLIAVAMCQVFARAGQPWWAALVPFYNFYVLLRVVGRPGWWLALMIIPIVNVVYLVIVAVDLAKAFGKDGAFAFLLVLPPFVGLPLLGFGSAAYRGPLADPAFRWRHAGYPPYPHHPYAPHPVPAAYPQQGYYPPQYPAQPYPPQPYPPQQYYPPR